MITTTNGNLELRELLQEVNEMMLTFRKLEIDIEKKNNSLQKTIVNISHDLKTPLTSALGYVELLQKYELSGEEQHKYESIIIDKLKQLSQLIEDFFTFTKKRRKPHFCDSRLSLLIFSSSRLLTLFMIIYS